jgi:tetratricopeptide (TPR) repeat protein
MKEDLIMVKYIVVIFCFIQSFLVVCQGKISLSNQLYDSAEVFHKKKDYELAQATIERSIYLYSTDRSNYLKGLILEAQGLDQSAIPAYEAVLKLNNAHQEARFRLALLYLKFKNPELAIKNFNVLLAGSDDAITRGVFFQIDPSGTNQTSVMTLSGLRAQMYDYRGRAHEQMLDYQMALSDYRKAISLSVGSDFFVDKGLLHLKLDQQDSAILLFEEALRLNPMDQLAFYNLLLLNVEVGLPDTLGFEDSFAPILSYKAAQALDKQDYTQALELLNVSLTIQEDVLALINHGRVLIKLKDFEGALIDFRRALLIDPDASECLYLSGNAYYFLKEFELALAYYQKYLAIYPQHGITWFNGAMALFSLKKSQEGCHYLRQALVCGEENALKLLELQCVN